MPQAPTEKTSGSGEGSTELARRPGCFSGPLRILQLGTPQGSNGQTKSNCGLCGPLNYSSSDEDEGLTLNSLRLILHSSVSHHPHSQTQGWPPYRHQGLLRIC